MIKNGKSAGAEVEQENVQPLEVFIPNLVREAEHESDYHQGEDNKAEPGVEKELAIYWLIYTHVVESMVTY